jgi:hypothetical protein
LLYSRKVDNLERKLSEFVTLLWDKDSTSPLWDKSNRK